MATPSGKSKKSSKSKTSPNEGTPPKRKRVATVESIISAVPTSEVEVESDTPPAVVETVVVQADDVSVNVTSAPIQAPTIPIQEKAQPIFKDPNFIHSSKGAAGGKKTRVWKNLKQIISNDRSLPWKATDVTYGSIDAPPSFKPGKKYSDLSGLEAIYVDPQTKLRYSTAEEFSRVRILPGDIVMGYLALRKANTPVP
ncbi:hypothetical protein SNE40_022993 [Patella caerulea]|uniref:Vps72/YL1 C-terminal domain-containing protein n=1 Tax=Patella caerulea TaxID=87958 RepID=A0AAN8J010_PATCE